MEQQQTTSKWVNSTSKAFWGVILISFSGIISTIYDYISYVAEFIEFIPSKLSGMLEDFGGSGIMPSIDMDSLFAIGFSSKGLIIIGYILYLWGLSSFASIQKNDSSIHNVKKVRTATILLIITFLLNIVFGVLSFIPFAGIIFGIITWVMFLICFYMMKHAYSELMIADDFSQRAQRGARNLRYAACCEIRLKCLPLVTGLIVLAVIAICVGMSASSKSFEDIKTITMIGTVLLAGILLFVFIIALFALFCAFWWPIIGWYRIKTGGPAETINSAEDSTENKEQIKTEELQEETHNLLQEEDSQPNVSKTVESPIEETSPAKGKETKWYYIGGVVGAIILCIALWFSIKGCSDDNTSIKLLPAQPAYWDKFVSPKSTATPIYEEPDISHVLVRTDQNTILPVLDETQNFYKVYMGAGGEGWVKKNQWQDIAYDPITSDMLSDIFLNGQHLNSLSRTYESGDLKDLILFYYQDFSSEGHLEVAILDSGRLIRPQFPSIDAVAVDKRGFTVTSASESGKPKLEFGNNYQIKKEDNEEYLEWDEHFLDLRKLSRKQVVEIWKAAQGDSPNKVTISYYFPSLKTLRLYDIDLNETKSDKGQVAEGNAGLSGFTYSVEGQYDSDMEATVYSLYAVTPTGEKVNTEITEVAIQLSIFAQGDYDGDGEREAIVYEWGGGNSVQPPYLVYYDAEEEVFKKVEGFEDANEDSEIKVEDWNDHTTFVTTVGLRHDRYVYSNHSLAIVERMAPNVGTRVATIPLSQLFKADGDDGVDKSIYIDIDGDGSTEKLFFYHDTSHASNWGKSMQLMKIEADSWSIPQNEDDNLGVSGNTFTFLASKNGVVPDILCDDAWLYKWNGERYVSP